MDVILFKFRKLKSKKIKRLLLKTKTKYLDIEIVNKLESKLFKKKTKGIDFYLESKNKEIF